MKDVKDAVMIPQLCKTHLALLMHQAGFGANDPWRALIVVTQIALFQSATTDSKVHELAGGNVQNIGSLGCLACFKPDAFGEIVEVAKHRRGDTQKALGRVKQLGERWVKEHTKS